jgi:hypothetical protein
MKVSLHQGKDDVENACDDSIGGFLALQNAVPTFFLLGLCRRRTAAMLITMISLHVRLETTIMSDMWGAYRARRNGTQAQRLFFYLHFMINHTFHFVDPVNPSIHTQTIEYKWQKWRANVHRKYGIHGKQYDLHIIKFNWRELFGRMNEVFYNF